MLLPKNRKKGERKRWATISVVYLMIALWSGSVGFISMLLVKVEALMGAPPTPPTWGGVAVTAVIGLSLMAASIAVTRHGLRRLKEDGVEV